jgi:ATP-dependent protease ClpP protease subunit
MDKLSEEQKHKISQLHKDKIKNITEIFKTKKDAITISNLLKKNDYEHTCSMNLVLEIPPPLEPIYIVV